MTTYQFGDITLEEFKPREWRAWRWLEKGESLKVGDLRELEHGVWLETCGVGDIVPNANVYRRPVPLPSIDPELAEVASIPEGVFKIAPSHEDVCDWLRALLPGYEERLANHVSTASNLVSDIPDKTPVPADGWRPIETHPRYHGAFFSEEFWAVRANGEVHRVVHSAWGIFAKDFWCRDWTHWMPGDSKQPLPPPPQEKGGEA